MNFNLNEKHQFNWADISYIDFDISNSFKALRKLNANQEQTLFESKRELDAIIKSIKEHNKDGEHEFIESYIHHLTYDDEIMIDEIQRLQRYALIMSIFAFHESRLKSLCDLIDKEFKFRIKVKNLNSHRGDLFRYQTYLNKIYDIPTEILKDLFTPLILQKKIRNLIVHSNGITDCNFIKEIPETEGINFKNYGDLFILHVDKDVYIEFLLKSIELFFESLLKEIDKKYTELKSI